MENIKIITFGKPYIQTQRTEPSSINGDVYVEKYKTIIEKVEEPKDVVCERLEKLWVECDNFHHWEPLMKKAKELDYVFIGSFGNKKPQ